MEKKNTSRKLKIQIDPQKEGGNYSNIATVIHSETEFLVDFGMFLPGRDSIRIASRVILNPRTAKQLMMALSQNVHNYEQKFGEISLPKNSSGTLPGNQTPELAQ